MVLVTAGHFGIITLSNDSRCGACTQWQVDTSIPDLWMINYPGLFYKLKCDILNQTIVSAVILYKALFVLWLTYFFVREI